MSFSIAGHLFFFPFETEPEAHTLLESFQDLAISGHCPHKGNTPRMPHPAQRTLEIQTQEPCAYTVSTLTTETCL